MSWQFTGSGVEGRWRREKGTWPISGALDLLEWRFTDGKQHSSALNSCPSSSVPLTKSMMLNCHQIIEYIYDVKVDIVSKFILSTLYLWKNNFVSLTLKSPESLRSPGTWKILSTLLSWLNYSLDGKASDSSSAVFQYLGRAWELGLKYQLTDISFLF